MYNYYENIRKLIKILTIIKIYKQKVYQMLVTMVEDIATVIDNSSEQNKIDERLANTINKSKTICIPLNSDFF
jgi:hypothetical protein